MKTKLIKLISNYDGAMDLIERDPYNNGNQAPTYLVVNWEDLTADVITRYKDGTTTGHEYHNIETAYRLPDDLDILKFQEDWEGSKLQERLSNIASTWYSEWNGSNYVGRFNVKGDESVDLYDELNSLPSIENIGVWDFVDWYCNGEEDYPENYKRMALDDIAEEMIYTARVEDYVLIRESNTSVVKILEERFYGDN